MNTFFQLTLSAGKINLEYNITFLWGFIIFNVSDF